jgi:uncharacterized membrane protein YhaH (DUF805 family)
MDKDKRIRETIRKQYLIVALVTLGIAAFAIGSGYVLDLVYQTLPRYTLIALIISSPITVWVNFGIIKRRLRALAQEIKEETQELPHE